MNLKPLHDRVLVEPEESEEKTKGGIIIPDTAKKDKPQKGEIVAVGDGKITEDGKVLPLNVKPGDKVLFAKYAGNEVKIDDKKFLVMRESDILAIIEK